MFEDESEIFARESITDKEKEIEQTVHDWGRESLSPEERSIWEGISDRESSRAIGFKSGAEYVYKRYLEWHYIDKEPLPEETCLVECVNGSVLLVYYIGSEHVSLTGGRPKGIFKWKRICLD